jgi:hypothetical protein
MTCPTCDLEYVDAIREVDGGVDEETRCIVVRLLRMIVRA